MEPKKKHPPVVFVFVVLIISGIVVSIIKPSPKPNIHDGIVTYKDSSGDMIYHLLACAVLVIVFIMARSIAHSLIAKLKKRKPIEENSNSAKLD
jgi:hypothetical protein